MLTSQPSVRRSLLQSEKPVRQVPEHVPVVQARLMLLVEQEIPQPPQFATSVLTLVSQPSTRRSALQSANPPEQAPLHTPAAHVRDAMFAPEQATLQPPQ